MKAAIHDDEVDNLIEDPKLKALMSKLKNHVQRSVNQGTDIKPPKTFEDFLANERVSEWPERLTSEKPDVDLTRATIGTAEDFYKELTQAIFSDFALVNSLEDRLSSLEASVSDYNALLFETSKRKIAKKSSPHTIALQQQLEASPALVSPAAEERHVAEKELIEQIIASERKTVRNCSFLGFFPGELNNFPEQIEATTILRRVTNAQDFSPSFKKLWKKVFLSEAAIGLLHDAFWWIFIDCYEASKKDNQSLLFDRMAHSFVCLFQCVHCEVRSKIFSLHTFPSCMAQAVFSIFLEAFPDSFELFGPDFRQYIANTISEWTAGIRAPPGVWRNWNEDLLRSRPLDTNRNIADSSVTQLLKEGKLSQEDLVKCLNIGGFADALNAINDQTNLMPLLTQIIEQLPDKSPRGRKPIKMSCSVGPGPVRELVALNAKGQYPLVAHFLYMNQLQNTTQPAGMRLQRTETLTEDTHGQTFQDIIDTSREMTQQIISEHKQDEEETAAAIREIRRQQREANQAIEKLKKEVTYNKNALEIKKMAEQLQANREKRLAAASATKEKFGQYEEDDNDSDSNL